jgi:ribosome-binding factor A
VREFTDDAKIRRQRRVADLVRQEIYEIFRFEVKDPRVRSLTITEVDLKQDLKSVIIYVCKFAEGDGHEPTAEEKAELMSGLKSSSHFIYESLKKRLAMKVIPSISFAYDERLAASSKIWGLIHSTQNKSSEGE